ncbi:MAG: histidine kinase, partial [Comamonas sp.]
LHVLAAPEDAMHAMQVDPSDVDAILQLAAAHYDFVLLDLPRMLDPLALRVLDRAQLIVPVLLPDVPAVRNAQKLLGMFQDLGYAQSRLNPVLNRLDRRSEIGLPEVRKALGLEQPWLSISDCPHEVQAAINAGLPLAQSQRGSAVVRELAAWADGLSPQAHQESGGLLNRLFRRA